MDKRILIGVGVVVVVVAFFVLGSFITGDVVSDDVKEFNVDAFRFGYSPDVIRVKQGDSVRITVDNTDTLHGIRFPDLDVAGMNSVEFVADKKGEFTWHCNNYCGDEHRVMSGTLIVE